MSEPKVRRFTLAKLGINLRELVLEKLRHLNVSDVCIVTRKGRPEVQVQVHNKECDQCSKQSLQ
jgi:hypothetical protein